MFPLITSATLLMSVSAAQASETLAEDSGCLGCHSVSDKVVGPAFVDVAAKYKGQKGAPAQLLQQVRKGSTGVWGKVAMPANKKVSDKDLKKIIAWILAQQ
ncbi:MAG: c-type cytochrome [Thiobacillus sp.]